MEIIIFNEKNDNLLTMSKLQFFVYLAKNDYEIFKTENKKIGIITHNEKFICKVNGVNYDVNEVIEEFENLINNECDLSQFETKEQAIKYLHLDLGGDYDEVIDYVEENWCI